MADVTLFGGTSHRFMQVVNHAGRVLAFSSRPRPASGLPGIGYSVLNPASASPDRSVAWSDFSFLSFPRQLRTVGRRVVTVDFGAAEVPTADVPFTVVSDGLYLYVFRQSTNGSLYFDTFAYDDPTGTVTPVWEVRYRRSGKPDLPLDKRDTFGSTDMTGRRFGHPTVELDFVTDLSDGRFTALVVPTELTGVSRWQLFTWSATAGRLNSFSVLRAGDGGFDVSESVDADGSVLPVNRFALTVDGEPLTLATAPGALLYHQQAWWPDPTGGASVQKLDARVMVAAATEPDGRLAVLDFGVGRDGLLARVGDNLAVAAAPTPGTAVEVVRDAGTGLAVPPLDTGTAITVEAWIQPVESVPGFAVVMQSAADAPVPFTLGLDDGLPVFVGPNGRTVTGDTPAGARVWTHLAATWDGTAALYVNGRRFTGPQAETVVPPQPPKAGYVIAGVAGPTGRLCDVRLWSVARSQDEILAAMCTVLSTDTSGWADLVGWWPMNEPSDDTRFTEAPNASALGAVADATLNGARWVPSNAPLGPSLAPVAWDKNGLTAATGLLGFGASAAAPVLVESADSLVHLYAVDRTGHHLIAAHLSPVVARAVYRLSWVAADPDDPDNDESGAVAMTARQPGVDMNATATAPPYVRVEPTSKQSDTVTVTLLGHTGYRERWPAVPRRLPAFGQVLNGDAAQVSDDPAEQARNVLMYDYTAVEVTAGHGGQQGPPPGPGGGSLLFRAVPYGLPTNGRTGVVLPTAEAPAELVAAGNDPRWQAAPPLLTVDKTGPGNHVEVLTTAALPGYRGPLAADRDVTVEAWVRWLKNPMDEPATVFVFNDPATARYALAVDASGYPVAVNGGICLRAARPVAVGAWTHVAAAYRTDFALQLGGSRYLDAGTNRSLDTSEAITIEAWVRLDAVGARQVVAAKVAAADPGWTLGVAPDGRPFFEVTRSTPTGPQTSTAHATTALAPGGWHHVVGVYDVAYQRVGALVFHTGSFVEIPPVKNPPTRSVTVAMWIRPAADGGPRQILMRTPLDFRAPFVFVLAMYGGDLALHVKDATGFHFAFSSTPLRVDDWQHVAASYQPGQPIQLTVDGVPMRLWSAPEPEALVWPDAAAEEAYVIGEPHSSFSFVGMMSEVSLWNRRLSIEEVRQKIQQPLAASERGLCGYWRLNDLYGTVAMDLAGTANGTITKANFVRVDKGAFAHKVFVDGRMEASNRVVDPLVVNGARLTFGSGGFRDYLQGALGEVRLWGAGRMNWQVGHFANRDLEPAANGLISYWTLSTGSGRIAYDDKGDGGENNAVLTDGVVDLTDDAVSAMWVPATFRATWRFVIDGAPVDAVPATPPAGIFASPQATIGAVTTGGRSGLEFTGGLQEVRVWSAELTPDQVREQMNGPVHAGTSGLAGYWPVDDGNARIITDRSGYGANGRWVGPAPWQVSTAPVGTEAPQVLRVPGGIVLPSTATSDWACGAGSYGVLQPRARGDAAAVLLRAYGYVDRATGDLSLLAGVAIGDLELQYVGQAQLKPTLVGYIEGTPPLPAENLKLYPGDPGAYTAAASLSLDEEGSRTFTYTANRDIGSDSNVVMRLGFNTETGISAGVGVEQEVFRFSLAAGQQTTAEENVALVGEGQLVDEASVLARKAVETRGLWKPNGYAIDGGNGDLFFPSNVGYALVRSGTADVLAMRIAGSGTLVGYTMRPNPDIPEDVNVLTFPLRDTYVKNGTLDGWIGFEPDTSYRGLSPGERGSYFKPLEAYALKRLIEREGEQRRLAFQAFDADGIGQRERSGNPGGLDLADTTVSLANVLMGRTDKTGLTSEQWKARAGARSMVNTYVWTAAGGLYSEEEQYTAVREESTGGSYSLTTQAGAYVDLSLNVGPSFSMTALFGSHIRTQATKADREQWQYLMNVTCEGERYIGLIEEDLEDYLLYTDKPSPGKVRAYRFMSFMLSPAKRNLDDFHQVVDEDWLYRQGPFAGKYDPDALALREALRNPNEVWRVLHRVTYVSRTPPVAQNEGESLSSELRRPDRQSELANASLIDELSVDPDQPNPMARVSVKADALLTELEGHPVWGPLLAATRAQVKQDLMAYMSSHYALPIAPVTATTHDNERKWHAQRDAADRRSG